MGSDTQTYISMLRGINVGGKRRINMIQLKEIYKSTSSENIETYLQSGNVIFHSNISDNKKISKIIQQKIKKQVGFDVLVLTKTKREFENIIKNNPYISDDKIDASKLHVTFAAGHGERTAKASSLGLDSDFSKIIASLKNLYESLSHLR